MPTAESATLPSDPALFATRLQPHRSLRAAHFRLLLMAFLAANIITSLPFIFLGAWPVAGFCGLDVALLYVAFKANFRAARAYEDFALTPFDLLVVKVSAAGERAEWRFNPAFVRLEREEHEEFGTLRLALVSRGMSLEVADFLGPGEKANFAGALSRALAEARRGPRYS
ncbi:conserved hypothetical protein [Methylocella silvestris BL2]|uniref:DUF2244 domain-containing protein n=1 Tax=Methylocella silvestris (strain DSM 15510 / CIP 108128 / LMG 27833 / NCIMB 13906 / BL2) TaxID=395965 RepID=B8EQI4_METSB|nr:DUF2244 domain-containing protein [Methylocella silvestris]ACK52197.1 conserved hypothetical protein [Methylocella silvestris BL2]